MAWTALSKCYIEHIVTLELSKYTYYLYGEMQKIFEMHLSIFMACHDWFPYAIVIY